MDKEMIGIRIRRHREKLSLSRDDFAEQIEISPRFLAEIESGAKGISVKTLCQVCEKTNLSADYLLLGRQSAGSVKTPAVEMLYSIPPRYTRDIGGILRAFIAAITDTEPGEG